MHKGSLGNLGTIRDLILDRNLYSETLCEYNPDLLNRQLATSDSGMSHCCLRGKQRQGAQSDSCPPICNSLTPSHVYNSANYM